MKKSFYPQITQIKRIEEREEFSRKGTLELVRGALTIKDKQ